MTSKKYNRDAFRHEPYEQNSRRVIVNLDDENSPGYPWMQIDYGGDIGSWQISCNLLWLQEFLESSYALIPFYYSLLNRKDQYVGIYGRSPEGFDYYAYWHLLVWARRNDGYKLPNMKMGRISLNRYDPRAYWNWKYGKDGSDD